MLITRLKSEETITSLCSGKVFIINCHGCKEVGFPEEEANALQKKLADAGKVVGTLTTDYVCNPTELALRLRGPMAKIAEADAVLVFSCGECFLNLTGGICPITACSKSLVNGPCGGTKNGKCEVCPEMDCGWERIIQRLKEQGRLDVLRCATQLHDFNTDQATKTAKESE